MRVGFARSRTVACVGLCREAAVDFSPGLQPVERCLACEADRSGPLVGRGSRKTEHHEQRLGVVRRLQIRIRLNACRAVVLAAPPLQEPIADRRLGSSIRLITLNCVDTLFAPLSFLVLREPRATKVPTESDSQARQRSMVFAIKASNPG
jgi:hypothetical protein